jgi:elongation factor Ts
MAAFTAKDVQSLREKTGVGMLECKKALEAADGDMDKAVDVLREKGLAAAAKKSGRIAAEGVVTAIYDNESGTAVLLEVNSETDFVGKNETFQAFVKDIAVTVAKQNPADVDALLSLKLNGSDRTVQENLQDKILTIGENLKIRRFTRLTGDVVTYVHGGGRIGVLVTYTTDKADETITAAMKDVAMQVAALNAQFLSKETVPAEVVEHEKEINIKLVMNEGKPQNIAEKIVVGRLEKYFKDVCLLNQPFVKNGDVSVGQYVQSVAKEAGANVVVTGFFRYEKGEGIAKKEDDFAAEVASMVQ